MPASDLVDALVSDLTPSRQPAPLPHAMFAWCGISWGLVGAVILTVGPLREGITTELIESPSARTRSGHRSARGNRSHAGRTRTRGARNASTAPLVERTPPALRGLG